MVFVNTTDYGGLSDGGVAAASLDPIFSDAIALHEIGHAAFGLADEYSTWAGCGSGETDRDDYPVATEGEPGEAHVTATLSPLKWAAHVTATAVPTTTNADCSQCDGQADPEPGAIGAYEGARYYHCGIWRPAFTCRMNSLLTTTFCAVCAARIGGILTWGSSLDLTPCFVATAVYGHPQHPDVVSLRAWRDRELGARGPRGAAMRVVARLYELAGPGLARFVQPRAQVRRVLRAAVFAPWARFVRRPKRPLADAPPPAATRRKACGCADARRSPRAIRH